MLQEQLTEGASDIVEKNPGATPEIANFFASEYPSMNGEDNVIKNAVDSLIGVNLCQNSYDAVRDKGAIPILEGIVGIISCQDLQANISINFAVEFLGTLQGGKLPENHILEQYETLKSSPKFKEKAAEYISRRQSILKRKVTNSDNQELEVDISTSEIPDYLRINNEALEINSLFSAMDDFLDEILSNNDSFDTDLFSVKNYTNSNATGDIYLKPLSRFHSLARNIKTNEFYILSDGSNEFINGDTEVGVEADDELKGFITVAFESNDQKYLIKKDGYKFVTEVELTANKARISLGDGVIVVGEKIYKPVGGEYVHIGYRKRSHSGEDKMYYQIGKIQFIHGQGIGTTVDGIEFVKTLIERYGYIITMSDSDDGKIINSTSGEIVCNYKSSDFIDRSTNMYEVYGVDSTEVLLKKGELYIAINGRTGKSRNVTINDKKVSWGNLLPNNPLIKKIFPEYENTYDLVMYCPLFREILNKVNYGLADEHDISHSVIEILNVFENTTFGGNEGISSDFKRTSCDRDQIIDILLKIKLNKDLNFMTDCLNGMKVGEYDGREFFYSEPYNFQILGKKQKKGSDDKPGFVRDKLGEYNILKDVLTDKIRLVKGIPTIEEDEKNTTELRKRETREDGPKYNLDIVMLKDYELVSENGENSDGYYKILLDGESHEFNFDENGNLEIIT